jgi:iron(III) transport system substrate-binding protein
MRLGRFGLLATVIALLLALWMPVSAQETNPVPLSGETLTVYSGRSEALIGPILQQFTAETGIQVEVRYGNTAEMAAAILEEGDNSPADVFIGQDAGALGVLAQEGRLTTLPSDILERVPAEFRSETNQWVGLSGRARVLVHSTALSEDQLPGSLVDVATDEWAGRVGWAPTNASLQSQVTAMRLLLGEDATRQWLEWMVANAVPFDGNGAVVQGIIDGEVELGLVNHYYLYGFLADNPDIPVANHFFAGGDVGSLINVAGAGVVNTSDQPGLSQRLILYLLGTSGQTYFAEETFEYPLVPGIATSFELVPLADIQAPEIDLSNLSDLQGTLDLMSQVGAL